MYRVLVFGMTENPGGVESVIMNYYRCIDKTKIQFDFLCNFHEDAAYEDELTAMGGNVFHITARSENYGKYKKELKAFFKDSQGTYDAIWVNVCSLANIDYLIMAKKYGIPRRIIHSHNSQNMDSKLRGMLHERNKKRIDKFATDFWTCSEDAAKWFYEDRLLPKVVMIRNSISVDRMSFDEEKRRNYRKKLHCDERTWVIGNVGRLHFQKNQKFCLDIFQHFLKKYPNACLVLIGQGEDETDLKMLTARYGISEKVYFAGMQTDICGWLSAFDTFLFPSKFEGLPIAALEAQANGVPMLASAKVIPQEVKINSNFAFLDLDEGSEVWSEHLSQMQKTAKRLDVSEVKQNFTEKGYNIETETVKLEKLFLKDVR